MALTLTVEDGTGLTNSNAYATVDEGDIYHDTHLYRSAWVGASAQDKIRSLVMATRLLDENYIWIGDKMNSNQALRWPRVGASDRDGFLIDTDEIPVILKNATIEFARLLLGEDRTAEVDTKGLKSVQAGSVSVVFDKGDIKQLTSRTIDVMLAPIGVPSTSTGFVSLARV